MQPNVGLLRVPINSVVIGQCTLECGYSNIGNCTSQLTSLERKREEKGACESEKDTKTERVRERKGERESQKDTEREREGVTCVRARKTHKKSVGERKGEHESQKDTEREIMYYREI